MNGLPAFTTDSASATGVLPLRDRANPYSDKALPASSGQLAESVSATADEAAKNSGPYGLTGGALNQAIAARLTGVKGSNSGISQIGEEGESGGEKVQAGVEVESAEEKAIAVTTRRGRDGEPLSESEVQVVEELEQDDREIRQHEQTHISAAGGYARGGASYSYSVGPDGKRYAVHGEVDIDASEESTPEETIRKMRIVKKAALAPKSPSTQDRRVASMAQVKENQARQEMVKEQREDTEDKVESQPGEKGRDLDEGDAAARSNNEDESVWVSADEPESPLAAATEVNADGEGWAALAPEESISRANKYAKRAFAVKAYTSSKRPEPMQPEVRAMQPGRARRTSIGAVPTLEPPEGSAADIPTLGSVS